MRGTLASDTFSVGATPFLVLAAWCAAAVTAATPRPTTEVATAI